MPLLSALLLLSAGAATATAPQEPGTLTGPIKMKASQIKAYNDGLPKSHPKYIRCESEKVTGSIAMRRKVCRTNQEWARVEDEGNRAAREALDGTVRGSTNGEPPTGG